MPTHLIRKREDMCQNFHVFDYNRNNENHRETNVEIICFLRPELFVIKNKCKCMKESFSLSLSLSLSLSPRINKAV